MARKEIIGHTVLTNVRLSYVHLDKPYSQNGGEPKYSATILVPKIPADNRARIDAAIQQAAAKAREKFGSAFPIQPKTSVHDGDGVRPSDGQPFGEECKGCWVFTASAKTQPQLRDVYGQPVLDSTEFYSGVYAHVGVTFFGYNAPQNKGIGAALDNVMKISDGEMLGGARASAEDDFADLVQPQSSSVPQPGYAAPQQGYTAPQQGYTAPQQGYSVPQQIDPITGMPYAEDVPF